MTRTYNAQPTYGGMFGRSWSFAYESTITKYCEGGIVNRGSGQELNYTTVSDLCAAYSTPVTLSPPVGISDTLTYYGSYFLFKEKESGDVYRFNQMPDLYTYRLASITDPNGNALTFTYNANGRIQNITDDAARVTTFGYNASNRCTSMTTPDGDTATYAYSASGSLIQSTDLAGAVITYAYDSEGYLTSLSTDGKTTSFAYGTEGGWKHVASVTDARGNKTTYNVVTADPREIKVTDAQGKVTRYKSKDGKTTEVINPLGYTKTTTYTSGLPVSIKDGNGGIASMVYDAKGNLTKYTDPLGKVTQYTYDANNNPVSMKNALDQTLTYSYDSKKNLLSVTSPSGKKITMTYDAKGQLLTVKDANGKTTTFTYTAKGSLQTVTDPLTKVTTMYYNASELKKTSEKDPRGNITYFTYDDNYRLTKVTHPDGTFRTYGCNACATTTVTDENGNSLQFQRDPMLNIIKAIDPLGKVTEQTYDKNGNPVSIKNALGQVGTMSYDGANQLLKTTDPSGYSNTMTRDGNGNIRTLTDARGNKTTMGYDAGNQLVSVTDPLNRKITFSYDAVGRLSALTNARGGVIGHTYDSDGQKTKKTYNGASAATYGYDNAGRLLTVADSTGTTIYTRDAVGRITKITYPDGYAASMSYDGNGNLVSITYPGGVTVSYGYDSRNRINQTAWGASSISFAYDGASNLLSETRSNGTRSNYTYDKNNRLSKVEHKAGASIFAQMTYSRNSIGDITQESNTSPVYPSFSDAIQNGSYDSANQLTKWAADTHSYDKDGNLTAIAGSKSWSLTYDLENRPLTISRNGSITTCVYNGLGFRPKVVRSGQTSNYRYDADGRLLFETNASNQIVMYYIYSGNRLVAMRTSSGATYFYHYDKTGSTIALTQANGTVAAAYAYEPFGKMSKKTGTLSNPFTYVGAYGVMDEGDGLYFMRNRYYDGTTGRFLQKDPIGFRGGANLYAYVANNPVEKTDPQGLLFGFNAGEEYVESWQQYFAEVSIQPVEGGILSTIGGYLKKTGAMTAGTLTSLWTRETSDAATITIVGGVCIYGIAVEGMALSALSAKIYAPLVIPPVLPTAGQAVVMLSQGAGAKLTTMLTAASQTPAGREALKLLHKEAAILMDQCARTGNYQFLNQLGTILNLSRFF